LGESETRFNCSFRMTFRPERRARRQTGSIRAFLAVAKM
jgi:hypothetical protein